MSSRPSLRKLFKLPRSKSRKVGIAVQRPGNNTMEWLVPVEPRSMKQGRGWVSSVRNQDAATYAEHASMADNQRTYSVAAAAGKNKAGRDKGSELQNKLIREATQGSSRRPGPKLPRRNYMPLKPGEAEQREFYVTLNNMPITPAKTPGKSKSKQRRSPRLTPGTPYERMGNTPSPAKSVRSSRKQLTPPRFNNLAN